MNLITYIDEQSYGSIFFIYLKTINGTYVMKNASRNSDYKMLIILFNEWIYSMMYHYELHCIWT